MREDVTLVDAASTGETSPSVARMRRTYVARCASLSAGGKVTTRSLLEMRRLREDHDLVERVYTEPGE